jgi:uncharacterized phiE125 gp8 family phage protein
VSDYTSVAATTLAVTVQDAKLHLNVSSTEDDTLITSQVKAATLLLEQKTSRCFVTQTRVLKADSFGDCRYVQGQRVYPVRSPLKSVSSISYLDSGGATTVMPSSDYVVSTGDQPGYIAPSYNASWPDVYQQPNSVTVTYVAGHSTVSTGVPENVKQAVRMVVGHWYRNRESVLVGTISKEIEMGVDALLESEMRERYG